MFYFLHIHARRWCNLESAVHTWGTRATSRAVWLHEWNPAISILLQFQRQSTEGTSYLLFALAMMGNGTYGFSVIVVLPALKGSKRTFIIKHLAWLIGSLGVLILDFFVSFWITRQGNANQLLHLIASILLFRGGDIAEILLCFCFEP